LDRCIAAPPAIGSLDTPQSGASAMPLESGSNDILVIVFCDKRILHFLITRPSCRGRTAHERIKAGIRSLSEAATPFDSPIARGRHRPRVKTMGRSR
jgi:hypothetical protein